MFSKPDVLETHLSSADSGAGVPEVGHQPFTPPGERLSGEIPPYCVSLCKACFIYLFFSKTMSPALLLF